MGSKRRRLALSCVDCRRRKVKCDRSLPACLRCQKGGNAETCNYVQYDDKHSSALPTPTEESPQATQRYRYNSTGVDSWADEAETWQRSSTLARVQDPRQKPNSSKRAPEHSLQELQEKVVELEAYMRLAGPRGVSAENLVRIGQAGPAGNIHRDAFQHHERALLRGRSFKTQYFGPSHATSLLLQFEELSAFTQEILQRIPTLECIRDSMKRIREDKAEDHQEPSEIQTNALVTLVPPRERADALVKEYFETFETTYRVLHVHSFYSQYKEYWKDPQEASAEFLVQLLLVMACVNAVVPGGPAGFVGRSSVARETATKWITACESWLAKQSQKHTYLAIYQIRVLIAIAKRVLCIKVKREYVNSGNLLRFAMSAGLHREPSFLSKKIDVFDQEMRRRLWFTIMELELQSACDRGFPTWVEWDCLAPLNIHDEDFSQTTQSMPSPKPLTEFTRNSFLCHTAQHLSLRLEILNRINSISHGLHLDAVMTYDAQLRQILDGIPQWLEQPLTSIPRALSRLVLYEFMLLLHQPFTTQDMAQSRYFYTRCARRNTSLTIMKIYRDLCLHHALGLANLREDSFRACLATCHDVSVAGYAKDDLMQDKTLAIELIQKTVDLLESRVKALGQGFHSYWLSSGALSLVRSKAAPELPLDVFAQEAADRVVRLHDDILAQQQSGYADKRFGDKLCHKAAEVAAPSQRGNEHPPLFEGFTPVPDPFNDSVFDFDLVDIWNMNSVDF